MVKYLQLFVGFLLYIARYVCPSGILCEEGYCRTYSFEVGCVSAAVNCRINNATHHGLTLPSPTTCNCCDYCLPTYGLNEPCSLGGPGIGTTIGRCSDGLTCVAEVDGNFCRRMESKCHSAQDDYDERHVKGEIGSLESRPLCDGKGNYASMDCVPTQTCFCQSEEGERIFGEVLYLGESTIQSMHCGCSRLHEKIKKNISPGVPHPVIGPRCTSDGNFNPVQCIDRVCHCVNRITGAASGSAIVNLDESPLSDLPCYDATLDLFPDRSEEGPFNYTSPCFETMSEDIEFLEQSEEDGFNVDYFSSVSECLPDGTYGRVARDRQGLKICVDERGQKVEDYEATPGTSEFDSMNCKCAQTSQLMESSNEKPVCCRNGNFRAVQCRRGVCRCVDDDGRQVGPDAADVTSLPCYTQEWRTCG